MYFNKQHRELIVLILSLIAITIFFIIISIRSVMAIDKCKDHIADVRIQHTRYLGSGYPWWYGIGVAMAESNCRDNITSFDGGQGRYQFTPSTGVGTVIEKEIPKVNFYNAEQSIRAHAFYISYIINKYYARGEFKFKGKYKINPKEYVEECGLRLADVYQYYNGGYWLIWEMTKADSCDRLDAQENCSRGGAWVGKKWLSFCEVNYSYPEKVYKYSQPYRVGKDSWEYW